jgi:cholesterol 7-dehydrogenase
VGDVKYLKLNGRHLVLYRGEDGIPYAMDAHCTHMGANLGFGGQVKWKSCIECPFHGWTFNVIFFFLNFLPVMGEEREFFYCFI